MEERFDLTERVIHAAAELSGMDPERLWESWHALEKANGFSYERTLIDFIITNLGR